MIEERNRQTAEMVEDEPLDFDRVVDRHQRSIFRLALGLTGNHHDAEDLAQQTFLKAYQSLNGFRGEASLGSWLHRIAVNTHIDRQRGHSEAVRRTQRSLDDRDHEVSSAARLHAVDNPETRTESATIQRHIEQALQVLSPRERAVFVLRHYQQLKLREIASVLDVSEGTVKSVLFRALRRLRKALSFYRPELGLKEPS
jgi:RNA polymerase sigma-70 factor (ECF subfamily)